MAPPMQITADEINCLIYSYLQDSGLQHTAFSLRTEGHLDASPYSAISVRRGELVELLAKSLLYSEAEAHWRADDIANACRAPFSLLQDHVCSPEDVPFGFVSFPHILPIQSQRTLLKTREQGFANGGLDPVQKRKASDKTVDDGPLPLEKKPRIRLGLALHPEAEDLKLTNTAGKNAQMEVDYEDVHELTNNQLHLVESVEPEQKPRSPVTLLRGHSTEVFVCSWNPVYSNVLATGAKDGSLRLWRFKPWTCDTYSHFGDTELTQDDVLSEGSIELKHAVPNQQADVTSIEWNPSGTLLASGSFDGIVRVWTVEGHLYMSERHHVGPIFSVKFSASGGVLLTAGLDGAVGVWDMDEKSLKTKIPCHADPCLDVDWLGVATFASASADRFIHLFNLSHSQPLVTFEGHTNEVNQIKCNQQRTLLASCSDDMTARIWEVTQWNVDDSLNNNAGLPILPIGRRTQSPLHTLEGHTDSIGSISWCPSTNDDSQILATAAFDATCRLWDAQTGGCLRVFADNSRPLFISSFSTDGAILATGGGDGLFQLYDMKTQNKIWKWQTDPDAPGVFEIEWQESQRVAICLENQCVAFVDLARIPSLVR